MCRILHNLTIKFTILNIICNLNGKILYTLNNLVSNILSAIGFLVRSCVNNYYAPRCYEFLVRGYENDDYV